MIGEESDEAICFERERAHIVGDHVAAHVVLRHSGEHPNAPFFELLKHEFAWVLSSEAVVSLDMGADENLDSIRVFLDLFLTLPGANREDLTDTTGESCFNPIGVLVAETETNVPSS